MAKTAINEVEVLRFFETETLDKATILFNIVADKMHGRIHGNHADDLQVVERRRTRVTKTAGVETATPPSGD